MSNQKEFIREHAMSNVWMHPLQDTQYVLRLARLTSGAGSMRTFNLVGENITLPDRYSRWHVCQIGGIDPKFFNLFPRTFQWISFVEAGNIRKLHSNIYVSDGVELPRTTSFYRYTENNALIVAIRIDGHIPVNFSSDTFYLRVYSNAYWSLPSNASNSDETFNIVGKVFESTAEVNAFRQDWSAAQAAYPEHCLSLYINGVRRNDITKVAFGVGDTAEYVIDTSIKARKVFKLKDLVVFESTLDNKRKYILHYPGKGDNVIDYFDDNDIYVTTNTRNTHCLYYHRNSADAVRQLTHKDYSISVPYAQRMVDKFAASFGVTNSDDLNVELFIRKSGATKPLVFEASLINELYKLPEEHIVGSMAGLNATVSFWQAANLEKGKYQELMRAKDMCAITSDLVEKAYGYHALASAIGENFVKVHDDVNKAVHVPYLYMFGSTAYEYDENGVMLGWAHHYVGPLYHAQNPETSFVEFLGGYGGQAFDEYNNVQTLPLRADASYRVYLRRNAAGSLQGGFTDITDSDKYVIENNVFKWKSGNSIDYPVVVSDRNFFASDFKINISGGRASIPIQTVQRHFGESLLRPIVILPGEFEVFMNGRSLIEHLEFFFKDNTIYITAKMPVNQDSDEQTVHIRSRGFCTKDGKMRRAGDIGFIQHNLLSANKRFDLRDGRLVRVIVAGQVFMKDQFAYSEESQAVNVTGNLNGYPYSVKDAYVPLKPGTTVSTYDLIDKDAVNAKKVSDYLTLRIPEPNRGPVTAQKIGYQVFSTFFSRLIMDLRSGRVFLPTKESFTRQEVMDACKNYEHLLEVDPISTEIDHSWLSILPHPFSAPVGLAVREYQFLRQAIDLYARGKIDIRTSVYIL